MNKSKVLSSPYALVSVMKEEQLITIDLTQKQIERSPSLTSDKPVSRQFEEAYPGYYGWPNYWDGPCMWGVHPNIVRDRVQGYWVDESVSRENSRGSQQLAHIKGVVANEC